jgi:hypothetical protein
MPTSPDAIANQNGGTSKKAPSPFDGGYKPVENLYLYNPTTVVEK